MVAIFSGGPARPIVTQRAWKTADGAARGNVPLMRERRDIYLDILRRGLLNARSAGYAGDAAQAATEADHLHNLPELLLHPGDERRHAFYWEGMRPSYLGESKPEYAQCFALLWAELEAANRAAGSGSGNV